MSEANNLSYEFWIVVGVAAIPILLVLLVELCLYIKEFSQELEYINMEIERTEGSERRHWRRRKRRLWLSLIPFVKY